MPDKEVIVTVRSFLRCSFAKKAKTWLLTILVKLTIFRTSHAETSLPNKQVPKKANEASATDDVSHADISALKLKACMN